MGRIKGTGRAAEKGESDRLPLIYRRNRQCLYINTINRQWL